MRVSFKEGTLDTQHKEGLLKKVHKTYYTIDTSILFSEEEKAIIDHYSLNHYDILTHRIDAPQLDERIRMERDKPADIKTIVHRDDPTTATIAIGTFYSNGETRTYRYIGYHPYDIVMFRMKMTDALHKAKQFIMAMVAQRDQPDTFEL